MAQVAIVEIKERKGKNVEDYLSRPYVLLDRSGKEFTSIGFARFLQERESVDFVIGGPYGVSDDVRNKAESIMSLSRMTFTHDMVRVFFLEQIFRAMTIIHGKEYHH